MCVCAHACGESGVSVSICVGSCGGGMVGHVPQPVCGEQGILLGAGPRLSFLTNLMSTFQGVFTAG